MIHTVASGIANSRCSMKWANFRTKLLPSASLILRWLSSITEESFIMLKRFPTWKLKRIEPHALDSKVSHIAMRSTCTQISASLQLVWSKAKVGSIWLISTEASTLANSPSAIESTTYNSPTAKNLSLPTSKTKKSTPTQLTSGNSSINLQAIPKKTV